jgi:phospholipid/cholesterol/gamma-HCH transport system substrate-binding protein
VRRILTVAVVLAACVGAFVLSGSSSSSSERTYRIVFDNAFGLVQGGDFRVGGVKAGKTDSFDVETTKNHAPKAVVIAKITQPGFEDFRKDAHCTILPQSLIGEYYVDCQPGSSNERLPTNGKGTVPVTQTESTVPTDLVQDIMRRPVRERFRLIITELGTGLAGRPDDLQAVLRRAHPGLRETSKVLKILGDQNKVIENFITDSDTVVKELEANKKDVARWVVTAGHAAEVSATRKADIARSFQRLPRFLDELKPTMFRLGQLADQQTPLLRDLRTAAPDLNTFFTRLGPFAQASRPALRSLGKASVVGNRAVKKGRNAIKELRALAVDAPPFAKPLRQFLESLDARNRAIETDPRAKATAPPAPDKTAIAGTGGFTGMEAIFDYVFWQTLSINIFDSTSHMVRLGLQVSQDCSNYENRRPGNDPTLQAKFKKCNSWLGPDQPGITSPDPTANTPAARALRAQNGKPAKKVGERRGPGQPDAGPLPGQRDISKPQVVLPPQVQQLLNKLVPKPGALPTPQEIQKKLPGSGLDQQQTNQLLDFLLSP